MLLIKYIIETTHDTIGYLNYGQMKKTMIDDTFHDYGQSCQVEPIELLIIIKRNEMKGVLCHESALSGYAGKGTTWAYSAESCLKTPFVSWGTINIQS